MPEYEEDFRAAAELERQGDAASGAQASPFYRAAQTRLLPCGRRWTDPAEYGRHMTAFERLQEKLCQLDVAATAQPDGLEDEWLRLARQGSYQEAAQRLALGVSQLVGAGYYEKRGRRTEALADRSSESGDPWGARISYIEALENYLMQSLCQPDPAFETAERVRDKLARLESG